MSEVEIFLCSVCCRSNEFPVYSFSKRISFSWNKMTLCTSG